MKKPNKLLLSPLRDWGSLLAASLCFGRPEAKRYVSRSQGIKVLTIILILFSSTSIACSCLPIEPDQYAKECEAVFIAVPIRSELRNTESEYTTVVGTLSKKRRHIKGDASSVTSIVNHRRGTSCDAFIALGESYIICANGEEKVQLGGFCGKTRGLLPNEIEPLILRINEHL